MLKISYAGYPGLYLAISSQFTLEMYAAAKHCEKFTKKPQFWGLKVIQGYRC